LVTLSVGGALDGAVPCQVRLADQRDLVAVVARVRRLLDLDADPQAVDAALSCDPTLAPLIGKRPGLRAPGAVDGFEMAVRAVIGQQVSVAGARTVLGRLAAEYGRVAFADEPWLVFPDAATIAGLDPTSLPMPRARGRTLVALARLLTDRGVVLDLGADRDVARQALTALPGIGPWTADYIRMRALSDPDVLLAGDLGIIKAAAAFGVDLAGGHPDWAPWRSYACHHLWAALH
jgi:AraC family transcriptional regulator of adaptative response / DNA-3-methyladenine glycosylase II